jgi:hypothetical protein
MRRLNWQRFCLAFACTLGLIAAGVGIFIYANNLSAVAVGLATLVIREIGGGKATAFGWFFDGAADSPPDKTTTVSVPDPTKPAILVTATTKPAAAVAAPAPTPAPASSYPIELPQAAYDTMVKDGWTDAQIIAAGMKPPTPPTKGAP